MDRKETPQRAFLCVLEQFRIDRRLTVTGFEDEGGGLLFPFAHELAGVDLRGAGGGVTQLGLQLLLPHTAVEVDTRPHMAQVVGADVVHSGASSNSAGRTDRAAEPGGEPLPFRCHYASI